MGRVAAVTPADCTLTTLGSFELRVRGTLVPSPATQKARALLAYLILNRRTDVPRERLVDVFWPDADPERARDSLNTALHSIRRGLRTAQFDPNDFLVANKSVARWDAAAEIDVDLLERALKDGSEAEAAEALDRYNGDFLEGDYDDWTAAQREVFAESYERLLAKAVRSTKAPDVAKKLLARNPYDEDAYATLIDAELRAGRHFSAAQIVRRCYAAFQEAGIEPSKEFSTKYDGLVRDAPRTNRALEVPFVGRDAELDELIQLMESERGSPRIAIVEGEPGIGKSALIERLLQHAPVQRVCALSVRGVYDDSRAFGVWPALYESVTGARFSEFLARTQGNAAAELAAAILEHIHDPTIVAVDDAQYLSGDAHATLAALAKSVALSDTHVVLIAVRPEGMEQLLQALGDAPHAAIRLAALSDDDVDTALALAGIEMDAVTTGTLRSRARGHPLYLKGLLEQLVRSGALRSDGKRWELSQPDADLQLPPSLRRLIEGRIRARGTEAVAVACALALEPGANATEIAKATELPEETVLDALDDLLGYHVIVELPSGPRQFAFSHDLLEETARHLLPAARRTRLHASFALVLSESDVRGRALRCAAHFEAAGMYAQAVHAYVEAAQDAANWQAPHDTLERCDAGLRCLAQLADRSELNVVASRLYQLRSFAYRLLWQLEPCFNDAQLAVDRARSSGNLRCLADALAVLRSAVTLTSMDIGLSHSIARELASVGERLNDNALVVQSLIDQGHAHRIRFEHERAEPPLQRAFDVAIGSGDPQLIVRAAVQLLSLQACTWKFERSRPVIDAVNTLEARVNRAYRAHAALSLAMLWTELERYDEAQAALTTVGSTLEAAQLTDSPSSIPNAPRSEIAVRLDYFQMVLDVRRGNWDRGLSNLSPYRSLYEPVLKEQRYRALFTAAEIDLLLGRNAPSDPLRAMDLLTEANIPWAPETGYQPSHAGTVLRARAHVCAGLAGARALLEEACNFLDAEVLRCPFGIDFALAQIAAAAAQAGELDLAGRAAGAAEVQRTRKFSGATNLVSV